MVTHGSISSSHGHPSLPPPLGPGRQVMEVMNPATLAAQPGVFLFSSATVQRVPPPGRVCVCVCVNAENSGGSVFFVWGTAERREGKRGNLHQERSVAASCSP